MCACVMWQRREASPAIIHHQASVIYHNVNLRCAPAQIQLPLPISPLHQAVVTLPSTYVCYVLFMILVLWAEYFPDEPHVRTYWHT